KQFCFQLWHTLKHKTYTTFYHITHICSFYFFLKYNIKDRLLEGVGHCQFIFIKCSSLTEKYSNILPCVSSNLPVGWFISALLFYRLLKIFCKFNLFLLSDH
uniref:Uncharacterized protein n=1 Tax=Poecilia formosa TaxID=48698 RepID=A0A096ME81_POEFO